MLSDLHQRKLLKRKKGDCELPVKELSPFVVVPRDKRIPIVRSPQIDSQGLEDLFDLARLQPSSSIPIQSPSVDAINFPNEEPSRIINDELALQDLSFHSISIDDVAPFKIRHDEEIGSITPQKRTWNEAQINQEEQELSAVHVSSPVSSIMEQVPSSLNKTTLHEQHYIDTYVAAEPVQEEIAQEEMMQEEMIQKEMIQKEMIQKEMIQEKMVQEEMVQEEMVQKEDTQEQNIYEPMMEDVMTDVQQTRLQTQEPSTQQQQQQQQQTINNEKQEQLKMMANIGNDDVDYGDNIYDDAFPGTPELVEDYNEEEDNNDLYLISLKEVKDLASQPTYLLKKTKTLANLHIVAIGKIAQTIMRDIRNSTNDQSSKDLIQNYYNMINNELKNFQRQYNKHVELDTALKHIRSYYKKRNKQLLSVVGEYNSVTRQIEQEEAQLAELEEKKKGFSSFDDLFNKIKQL